MQRPYAYLLSINSGPGAALSTWCALTPWIFSRPSCHVEKAGAGTGTSELWGRLCLVKKAPLCNSHFTHAYLPFSLGEWDQSLSVCCMSVSLSLCIFVSPLPFLFLWQCCPIYPRLVSNSRAQVNALLRPLEAWVRGCFFHFNRHIITMHVYKAQRGVPIHICGVMIN